MRVSKEKIVNPKISAQIRLCKSDWKQKHGLRVLIGLALNNWA